jgi:hypothetical protein
MRRAGFKKKMVSRVLNRGLSENDAHLDGAVNHKLSCHMAPFCRVSWLQNSAYVL